MDDLELTPTIPDAEEAAPVADQPARVFDVGERPDCILAKYVDLNNATVAIEDYNLSVNKKVRHSHDTHRARSHGVRDWGLGFEVLGMTGELR